MNRIAKLVVSTAFCGLMFPTAAYAQTNSSPVHVTSHARYSTSAKRTTAKTTTYVVKSGDTLWSVARRFHTTVSNLAKTNHLKTNGVLRIGQRLTVPYSGVTGRSGSDLTGIAASARGEEVALYAERFVGVPYRWAGSSPSGFDCSGLVRYVYQHFGITLLRTSYDMYCEGTAVSRSDLQPGMLVFFDTYGSGASHVGIYLGNGRFISAQSHSVQIASLSDSYWGRHYVGARNVF